MKRSPPLASDDSGAATPEAKFIVNVSAMEGQFYRYKTDRHPHTNMAKARCPCNPTYHCMAMRLTINIPFFGHQAALNMMTRTSGPDYAADGIYMTSVDTGWVTDGACSPSLLFIFINEDFKLIHHHTTENPWPVRLETGFCPPLDCKDGAARTCWVG